MPVPPARGKDKVDSILVPTNESCGTRCRAEVRALESYDAFGTLMMNLAHRVDVGRRRKRAGAGATGLMHGAQGGLATALQEEEDEKASRWSRLEEAWRTGAQRLKTAAWRTPAISCERAISLEEGLRATTRS